MATDAPILAFGRSGLSFCGEAAPVDDAEVDFLGRVRGIFLVLFGWPSQASQDALNTSISSSTQLRRTSIPLCFDHTGTNTQLKGAPFVQPVTTVNTSKMPRKAAPAYVIGVGMVRGTESLCILHH